MLDNLRFYYREHLLFVSCTLCITFPKLRFRQPRLLVKKFWKGVKIIFIINQWFKKKKAFLYLLRNVLYRMEFGYVAICMTSEKRSILIKMSIHAWGQVPICYKNPQITPLLKKKRKKKWFRKSKVSPCLNSTFSLQDLWKVGAETTKAATDSEFPHWEIYISIQAIT